jgi:hypothetical protein
MRAALLFLVACGPSKAPAAAPCPYVMIAERKQPETTRYVHINCGDYGPPQPPHLDSCADPLDVYTPGSCANINRARRLDYSVRLEQWGDYMTATCGLFDKPTWGAKP